MSNIPSVTFSSNAITNARITVANNKSTTVEAIGTTQINALANMKKNIRISDVFHVPKLISNLLLVK